VWQEVYDTEQRYMEIADHLLRSHEP
jgi:hypothetical protein